MLFNCFYLLLCIDEDLSTDPGILSQRLNYLCLNYCGSESCASLGAFITHKL